MKSSCASVCLLSLVICNALHAQDVCSPILREGIRDNYSVLQDRQRFELYQSALCDAKFSSYESFASGARKSGFSLATAEAMLGLSSNSSERKTNFTQAYSKFCHQSYESGASTTHFEQNASSVNTELAQIFSACVTNVLSYMSDNRLDIYLDVTPQADFSKFNLRVRRRTSSATTVTGIVPSTVSCSIGEQLVKPGTVINSNMTLMECRKPPNEPVKFGMSTAGEGYSNEVNLPAASDRLGELEERISHLERGQSVASPDEIVILVQAENCPLGWKTYSKAYGRFVRGIDPRKGSRIDPDGTRDPGDQQEDAIGRHTHGYVSYTSVRRAGRGGDDKFWAPWVQNPRDPKENSPPYLIKQTDPSKDAGPETRPKNVALLFCEKATAA